jgi:hypothetical protein
LTLLGLVLLGAGAAAAGTGRAVPSIGVIDEATDPEARPDRTGVPHRPAPASRRDRGLAIDRCPPAAVPAPRRRQAAAERYERGRDLYLAGDYSAAADEFIAAYCVSPHYLMLENIAQAFERQIDYENAVAYLHRYLAEIPAEDELRRKRALHRARVLANLPARLTVATEPPGAAVSLRPLTGGGAPLPAPRISGRGGAAMQVKSGLYELRVELADHQPVTQRIALRIGQPYSFYFRLQPEMGMLRVTTQPRGARVFIDRRLVGSAPYQGPVTAGPHEVVAEAASHTLGLHRVEVRRGRLTEAHLELARLPVSGRFELVAASTVAGLVLGSAGFGQAAGPDYPTVLLGGAGMGVGLLASSLWLSPAIPQGTSLFIVGSAAVATADVGIVAAMAGAEERVLVRSLLAGGVAGAAAGAFIAPHLALSGGDASLVNSGSMWGGFAGGLVTSLRQREVGWEALLGINGGLATGLVLARYSRASRARILLIDLTGLAGVLAGVGIAELNARSAAEAADPEWYALGGMGAGLLTGVLLTRSYDDVELGPGQLAPQLSTVRDRGGRDVVQLGLRGRF